MLVERVADALDADLVPARGLNSDVLSFATAASIAALRSGVSRRCPRAPRRRGSAPSPARRRTPTRSGRSPAACPSPGSRTRPSGSRRLSRRARSARRGSPAQPRTTRHGCVGAPRASSARARRSTVVRVLRDGRSFRTSAPHPQFLLRAGPVSRCSGYDPPASRNSSVDCVNRSPTRVRTRSLPWVTNGAA